MQWGFPLAWLLILNAVIVAVMVGVVWRRRKAPGARAFIIMLLAVSLWSLWYGLELFNVTLAGKLFWSRLTYLGITTVPSAWFVLALDYSGRGSWINRRTLPLLLIHPLVISALSLTNEMHHLILQPSHLTEVWGYVLIVSAGFGIGFWVHAAVSYGLLLAGMVIIIQTAVRAPNLYRGQVISLLVGAFAPWISNAFLLISGFPVDPTPLSFTITATALGLSIVRFRLFNLAPVARGRIVDTMSDGMLVVDDNGRVIDFNPAMFTLLARLKQLTLARSLAGKHWQTLFGAWSESLAPFFATSELRQDIDFGAPDAPHWYEVNVSPVYDRTAQDGDARRVAGRVLIFHDIQESKRISELIAQAHQEALQASLLKGQLVANVSHELRAPLNEIISATETLLEGGHGLLSDGQAELVSQLFQSARQMDLFTAGLLDRFLIEKGALTLTPEVFNPRLLADQVRALEANSAGLMGVDLSFSIDPDLPLKLVCDAKRIQQMLANLVNAAVKKTTAGAVRVHLFRRDERCWGMEVTGAGVGAVARSHAVSPDLVALMGGDIEIEGSTLRIILPLVAA